MDRIYSYEIQSNGRVKIEYGEGKSNRHFAARFSLSKTAALLQAEFPPFDPTRLSVGVKVWRDGDKIVSTNNFGMVRSGRKPIGKRAMTNAERMKAYRERKKAREET